MAAAIVQVLNAPDPLSSFLGVASPVRARKDEVMENPAKK